jgi:hypothetical protein
MEVIGSYHDTGYAHLAKLIPPEVAQAFVQGLRKDVTPGPIPLHVIKEHSNVLRRPAFEIYGYQYKPMLFFLWALTPIVSEIVGRDLLPTYDYFRIYQRGDICRVHSDRHSCEHSLSLTLAYSNNKSWDLEIGKDRQEPGPSVDENFGTEDFASIAMEVGDAVLYQGVHHRHGRTRANPNRWSAHLFLHWVDRDGPYREHAFDGRLDAAKADFVFT